MYTLYACEYIHSSICCNVDLYTNSLDTLLSYYFSYNSFILDGHYDTRNYDFNDSMYYLESKEKYIRYIGAS